jgi:hypothetical protein
MTPAMTAVILLLGLSIAWAAYQYVASERSNRASWSTAPLPPIAIDEGPYRSTSVEQRRASAPFAVKVTAFMCFLVGPAFGLVMLLPALFFARSALFASGGRTVGYVDHAWMVYRLGPPLLARDCRTVFGLDYTMRLLRLAGATLGVFAVFGLLRGAWDTFFVGIATFAGVLFLMSLLLAYANRVHGSLFAQTGSAAT